MSTEQTAIDQEDFDEMSMIAEQHAKKEDDVTCSDVRELREARLRIVELEAHCSVLLDTLIKSQDWDWLSAGEDSIIKGIDYYDIQEMQELYEAGQKSPKQSLAEIQAKAVLDYENSLSSFHGTAEDYANQLRANAKE